MPDDLLFEDGDSWELEDGSGGIAKESLSGEATGSGIGTGVLIVGKILKGTSTGSATATGSLTVGVQSAAITGGGMPKQSRRSIEKARKEDERQDNERQDKRQDDEDFTQNLENQFNQIHGLDPDPEIEKAVEAPKRPTAKTVQEIPVTVKEFERLLQQETETKKLGRQIDLIDKKIEQKRLDQVAEEEEAELLLLFSGV